MSLLKVENSAPEFSLLNQDNKVIQLKDFKDKNNILLYFYPKASTPGCTTQACGIRDYTHEFQQLNTVVLAVSPDAPAKLKKFHTKYNLNFNLLSDEDHSVAATYNVWGLKKFMGRELMGIIRTSFFIGVDGKLKKVFQKVNAKTHHDDVTNYIKNLI